MTTDLKEIERSALNLVRMDKARLADKSLQSIHGNIDPEIEQAWIQEIEKRKESFKSGEASLHPASEVVKQARERIHKSVHVNSVSVTLAEPMEIFPNTTGK